MNRCPDEPIAQSGVSRVDPADAIEDVVAGATEEEVDYTIDLLRGKIAKLRELSPLWEMYKDGIDLNSIQWAAH